MKNLFFLLFVAITACYSCGATADKKEVSTESELSSIPIALYSAENTSKSLPSKCAFDAQSLQLKNEILKNTDILSYSEKDLILTVTSEGYEKIRKLQDAQPFVLTVAGDATLVGLFKPFISAGICEHSVLMNYKENNKIYFFTDNLTVLKESDKIAKVNNPAFLKALRESGRLK